jgi:alkanesulfonate monooxygenase SsuD/methylene tetrahydromethanopterin reductase-like flavin-dependent oxidoreductase (luciferase family)
MSSFFQNYLHARTDREVYQQELALADLAEQWGFGSVWAAEHHFDDYTMSPDVLQFLTWVGARTQRVRLGSMVVVLPWHDPVRVAENVSVLDHMSGGRLVLGIGRGLGRIEFNGFRKEMSESRQRFAEYAEAILTAFDTGFIEFDGELYTQPRTAIKPEPLAPLRGRTYASAISPESYELMARLGIGVMIVPQKPWPMIAADIDAYRSVYWDVNGCEPPKPLMVVFVAVHEDRARAQEMFEEYTLNYFKSAVDHYEFANAHLATIPGYEYYGRLSENLATHGTDTFVRFLSDLQPWGTPDDVTDKLVDNVRRIDGGGVIAVFSYGGMDHDTARANMQLFAEKVRPALEQTDPDRGIAVIGSIPTPR